MPQDLNSMIQTGQNRALPPSPGTGYAFTPTSGTNQTVQPQPTSDINSLGFQVLQMLQKQQQQGQQVVNAGIQEQASRGLAPTPQDLIGASPAQQNQARNASVGAVAPTIGAARDYQSQIGQNIQGVRDFITYVSNENDKRRTNARTLINQALTQFGGDAFTGTDPQEVALLEKEAGFPKGYIEQGKTTLKQRDIALRSQQSSITDYYKALAQGINPVGPLPPGVTPQSNAIGTNSTLQDFFNAYAPASDHNDPVAYANAVAQKVGGIDASTLLTDLAGKENDIMNAIADHEGFFNGTSTVAIANNNPGNLKFANQPGAKPGQGGFAKFPNLQAGFNALKNDIHAKIAKAYNLTAGDFDVAKQLSTGQLGLIAFQRLFGGLSTKPAVMERRANLLKLAKQLNPNFDEAKYEQGQKFGGNANTQKTLAAIDAVKNTFGIIGGLVDNAVNTGIPFINRIVVPGAIDVGSVSTSNFATAATALADELSGVLGYGSATDMKLQLGIDLTNPTQSPQQFKSNLEIVKKLVQNREDGVNSQIWQGTGAEPQLKTNQNAVKLKDPKTGQVRSFTNLSPDDIQSALSQGYIQQ